jgi:hypothetical protein
MKKKLMDLYLDWVNNFLTVERFAEYYELSLERAHRVINLGRTLHEKRVEKWRQSHFEGVRK